MAKSILGWISAILVIVGALNWGLYGLFDFDIVNLIFGTFGWLATIVYVLIGLAGIYELIKLFKK